MVMYPEEILNESPIEKKEKKLKEFSGIKERLAFLNRRDEKSQDEFNKYIHLLLENENCKYMANHREVLSLCNHNLFDCKFRSRDNFNHNGKLKFECTREKTLKLKSLL
ncbi:MAG: hypothetical protein QF824_02245 [Candidatus Woesearchaeota archaeon]|jgi:hypothetical protein|nr:hypothetical protein [Candidatus Woesearchaeota archaeon]